jgi:hypothetical protein
VTEVPKRELYIVRDLLSIRAGRKQRKPRVRQQENRPPKRSKNDERALN